MEVRDIVRRVFTDIEKGDLDAASRHLTDNFTFSGPVPEPIGKEEFIALHRALLKAIPDWKFNVEGISTHGLLAQTKVHITGTHTGVLDPVIPGMYPVPPTGKHIELPREPVLISTSGDKVSKFEANTVDGGGVLGILAQIGVSVPPSSPASRDTT